MLWMLLHPSIRLYCERRRLSREAFLGAEFYVNIPEDLAAEAEVTADDQVVGDTLRKMGYLVCWCAGVLICRLNGFG